jgi:hypothetical protein
MKRQATNIAASVRARLTELARQRGVEFQLVLSEFAIERLLYRLGVSPHAERFVLKGATLFKLWSGDARRATWDLDLLGRGANGVADVVAVLREVCEIEANDGIVFVSKSIKGEEIRVRTSMQESVCAWKHTWTRHEFRCRSMWASAMPWYRLRYWKPIRYYSITTRHAFSSTRAKPSSPRNWRPWSLWA